MINFEVTNAMMDEIASTFAEIPARLLAEARTASDELAAKLTALFAECGERLGPGTVPGDALSIVGKQTTPTEREAACGRLASALGLNDRQRLRPQAIRALRSIAEHERLAESKILGHEIPISLIEALSAFDEPDQTRRDGKVWRKDARGKITHFAPADEYTFQDLLGGRGQAHLRDLARRYLESALIERSGLSINDDSHTEWTETPAHSPSSEEEILNLADRKQAALLLETVIPQLSRRQREVFDLLKQGITEAREIAMELGLEEPTVRRVKSKIRGKITKMVKKNMIALAGSSPLISRRPIDGKVLGYPRRSLR